MKQLFAIAAILAVSSGPALAQEIPEGQSCGGLFCDLGIFGHKTAPVAVVPAAPAAPRAVRTEAVPAAAATEPTAAEPRRRIVHRKRAIEETRTAAAPAVPKATPVAAPVAVPKATPVAAPVAAPMAPVVAKRPPAPPSDEPVIFVSPASQAPAAVLKNMFQPIYR